MRVHQALSLLLPLFLTACSSPRVDASQRGAALEPFTRAEVVEQARMLMAEQNFSDARQGDMLRSLNAYLDSDTFKNQVGEGSVTGVIAYSFGAGGLIVAGGSAGITASFKGGKSAVPATASFTSLGGIAGGKAGWGIGLLSGLEYEGWFIGEYKGSGAAATALESTVAGSNLTHTQFGHKLHTIGGGVGLMASAGTTKAVVSWK